MSGRAPSWARVRSRLVAQLCCAPACPLCGSIALANEPSAECPVPVTGTVTAISVVTSAVLNTASVTFHARYDGSNFTTDLSCTVTGATDAWCYANGGSQSVAESNGIAFNTIDVSAIASGSPPSQPYYVTLKIAKAN